MKNGLISCGIFLVLAIICVVVSLTGLAVIGYMAEDTMTPRAAVNTPAMNTPVIATLTPAPATQSATLPTTAPVYTPPAAYTPASPPLSNQIPYRAVVQILAETRQGNTLEPIWSGSGTIIDPRGFILTNAHVALSGEEGRVDALQILLTEAEDKPPVPRYYAEVVDADKQMDIAILRIVSDINGNPVNPENLHLPYVRLGDSDQLHLGQPLIILGYPGIGGNTITVTRGEVSGFTAETGYGDRAFIKTSATIAGGNSGGMVADNEGNLVAIPTMLGSGDMTGDVVDCRYLADTNGDGYIDEDDACVPTGGFINALRPINLAKPMIEKVVGIQIASPETTPTPANPTLAPTPTPTEIALAPTPTPTTEEHAQQVIVQDDFSDADHNRWPIWEEESWATTYVDGWYQILIKEPGWIVWGDANQSLADAIIEVDVKKVAGEDSESDFGVVCRKIDDYSFYYFAITGNGYYQIFRAKGGEGNGLSMVPLKGDWIYSPWIKEGDNAVNHMRVSCIGDTLTLEVNGHELAVIQDDHYQGAGEIGLIASTYDTDYLDVRFDNFVLSTP